MAPALERNWEMSTVIRRPPGGVSAEERCLLAARTQLPPLQQLAAKSLRTFPDRVPPLLARPPGSLWQEWPAWLLGASEPLHCAATDGAPGRGAGPAP